MGNEGRPMDFRFPGGRERNKEAVRISVRRRFGLVDYVKEQTELRRGDLHLRWPFWVYLSTCSMLFLFFKLVSRFFRWGGVKAGPSPQPSPKGRGRRHGSFLHSSILISYRVLCPRGPLLERSSTTMSMSGEVRDEMSLSVAEAGEISVHLVWICPRASGRPRSAKKISAARGHGNHCGFCFVRLP